jgi:hypothetical protein
VVVVGGGRVGVGLEGTVDGVVAGTVVVVARVAVVARVVVVAKLVVVARA